MLRRARHRVAAVLLAMVCLGHADVQAQGQTPQQRREDLLKVQELINDPDPLIRIANFEALTKENDPQKVEMAIRIAMTSQDAALRSLATVAYLAGVQTIGLEIVLPPDVARRWEAVKDDRRGQREFLRDNPSAATLAAARSGRAHFHFANIRPGAKDGDVASTTDGRAPSREMSRFRVLGDRIVFTTYVYLGSTRNMCDVELRGTRDLTIVGAMGCQGRWGPVALRAPMY
jgi:hypothetical protein